MNAYETFLERKAQIGQFGGFEPLWIPDFLYDFQQELTAWNIRKGKSETMADCGLGKTPMQLVWAENVVRHTNRPVLILTPLAVAAQTVREAEKFGIEAKQSRDGKVHSNITVTNYQQLHKFNPNDVAGVVCDESSCLKNADSKTRTVVTEFLKKIPYRLLATATAAPNDYPEIGTSAEALGELGYMDMLNRFFKNDLNNSATGRIRGQAVKWRFKGHAEKPFWRWVSSWCRALRKPSDLGFKDDGFVLPELIQREHVVQPREATPGFLFSMPATTMPEQRAERRRTLKERCEMVAELVCQHETSLAWCQLNPEGDLLEKIIPGAVQISGSDSDEVKEERFQAFADGQIRRLVTKARIGCWGLNLQNCNHTTFFPDHSYEQFYQGVRRFWRFGQTRPVTVDIVSTEGDTAVLANLNRKAAQADKMFSELCRYMNDAIHIERIQSHFDQEVSAPKWLTA